jgi:Glycosyl transferases group 1
MAEAASIGAALDRFEAARASSGTCEGRPAPERDALAVQVARERGRADAANARADRERERAWQATERALAAEARLAEIEASAAWRLTWPARRLAYAVPKPIYNLVRRAPGRLLRAVRGGPERRPPPPPVSAPTRSEPSRGPAALLIDDHWPRPDRDAGSIEIVNLAEALRDLGFEVWFAADRDHATDTGGHWPIRDALTARGIRCLRPADAPSVGAFLEQEGTRFALVVLNRVYGGGRFMEDVLRHCTAARIIFNTIDLHHLRLLREADLRGDAPALAAAAAAAREREEALAREADATIVVSETERRLLAASIPGANIVVLPLARDVCPPRTPFEARFGVGFIGGFAHAPNLDAVRFFLAEIWPLVLRGNPRCEFSIVGADLPPAVLDGVSGAVRYHGPVPDAAPWFESLRLTVAPLRFGAGVKGKVVSSLAAGVPCVATPLAIEGMGLRDGDGVLVASSPELLAEHVLRVHDNPCLWADLSAGGLAQVAARFSPVAWRKTLAEALWVMDVLPDAAAGTSGPG